MPQRHIKPALADRALVLAVADAEREGTQWLDAAGTPYAEELDDDSLVIARARRIATERGFEGAVRRALDAQRLLWPVAGVVGLVAGLSAAWAGLAGGGDPTSPEAADLNILWFLQVTLGLHTAFFVLSFVATSAALSSAAHPLTRVARAGALALGRLIAAGRAGVGARAAVAAALGGRRGALFAGALGHTAGLGFVIGAVMALLMAASFREQYRFFWKSTLLSGGQAAALIEAVAAGPRAIGLPAPDAREIAAARAGLAPSSAAGEAGAETAEWAWMLVGALLVWGAGPRLAALTASLGAMGVVSSKAPLPVSASYRRRAVERARRSGERGSEHGVGRDSSAAPAARVREDDRPLGAPAMLGYELDADGLWPPREVGAWTDLGLVDGASDRRRVLGSLDAAATRPGAIVAFFSRGETPAEAERRFLGELVARGADGTAVVLTLSRALATDRTDRDAERIAHRTALWRDAAERAGVRPERIIEVDLHHLTGATAARVRELAGGSEPSGRHVRSGAAERALADIEAWAGRGDGSPASLAALLRSIDAAFGRTPLWRRALGAARSLDLDGAGALVTESARSLGRLLPGWLPRHPGWMAATAALATTGTLSAVLLAGGPIGLAAGLWPLYAAVGAALGEAGGRAANAIRPEETGEREAVATGARAAVLHALVLNFQGMPDEEVARSIDGVLRGAPEALSEAEVGPLLAHVRARLREMGRPPGGGP